MTDLKPEDLARLREIAEKATPGPWSHDRADDPSASFEVFGHDGSDYENFVADCRIGQANAEFIATFDPPMVLSLLADRARMEKALREIAEHPGPHADEAAHWRADAARQALGASQ